MIPPSLYIHPRPRMVYEPPMANQPRQPVVRPSTEARLRAIRQARYVEQQVVRDRWPHSQANNRGCFTVHSPEDGQTAGEALRLKHRTQICEAWKTSNVTCEPRRTSDLLSTLSPELSTSTLCVPTMAPSSLPECTDSSADMVRRDHPIHSRSPGSSVGHTTAADPIRRPVIRLLEASENAHRSPSSAPKPQTGHRPSRSHSSSLRRSLSRLSSQQPLVADPAANTLPRWRTSSASRILSFVRRLAPLPRFNPYRRSRAESTSALVDDTR
ncbi:hypothetical protein LXA43DRAFT_627311 [Ganoderma leucocontextum]|nr:hypothetical protein LXA43DRAFT_627311 [Ganoderma leucocontextum]